LTLPRGNIGYKKHHVSLQKNIAQASEEKSSNNLLSDMRLHLFLALTASLALASDDCAAPETGNDSQAIASSQPISAQTKQASQLQLNAVPCASHRICVRAMQ